MNPNLLLSTTTASLMSRRKFLSICTVTCGAILAGCAPKNIGGARTTLRQWYHEYGQAGTQEAVLRYAKEYTRINPEVAIEIVWTPGDYGTKIATALLTSEGPDIFEGQLTVPNVTAGQVAPLDDIFTSARFTQSNRWTIPGCCTTVRAC
jgi:multiple sugar transport system substrate-binding protein